MGDCWHMLVRKGCFFSKQVSNKKTHYPPKVNGAQMANLHSDVATTGGWMSVTRFLTQFTAKREKYPTLWHQKWEKLGWLERPSKSSSVEVLNHLILGALRYKQEVPRSWCHQTPAVGHSDTGKVIQVWWPGCAPVLERLLSPSRLHRIWTKRKTLRKISWAS